MDAGEIRAILAGGLEAGAVQEINDVETRDAFLAGRIDLPFAELSMDSLARMELCIAIEVGTGVSLAPEDLAKYESVGALAAMLVERLRA